MRAARLHDVVKCLRLLGKGRCQLVQHRVERIQREQRRQAHGSRKDVVGRLPVVHVVIGVDRGVLPKFPSQDLVGSVGDHLVAVHVQAYARSGLENIDHELIIPLAVDHFLGRLDDGVGTLLIHQAKFLIGLRGGPLHHPQGAYKLGMRAHAGNGEIVHRAHCLRAVIGLRWHLNKTQRVFFFAEFRHREAGS